MEVLLPSDELRLDGRGGNISGRDKGLFCDLGLCLLNSISNGSNIARLYALGGLIFLNLPFSVAV